MQMSGCGSRKFANPNVPDGVEAASAVGLVKSRYATVTLVAEQPTEGRVLELTGDGCGPVPSPMLGGSAELKIRSNQGGESGPNGPMGQRAAEGTYVLAFREKPVSNRSEFE
jgi:hypothetical protein